MKTILLAFLTSTLCLLLSISYSIADDDYPILFATQIPIADDFISIGSTFGNHVPSLQQTGRGGDLWIRYTDGALKNLTRAAGYGNTGFQGLNSIAVRDPAVHWEANKVIFSMALNSTVKQFQWETYYWQLYEITGLAQNETPVISKVPRQPENYNNISPVYGTDARILFASDRPRKGLAHLYPQRDEYESSPTVSGLWSLNPQTGNLFMVTHAPSGDFTPILDSYGRVIFTRWDHLQRDQQADADIVYGNSSTFNWSSESASATALDERTEVFPEPRSERVDLLVGTGLRGHVFNHFFPWMVNEDGSELETLNHIGRHELHSYFDKSVDGDPNLQEFISATVDRVNQNAINNFFQIQEDPLRPGYYIGVDAPEFNSHASGQIIELQMPPGMNPDLAQVVYRTSRATESITQDPATDHTGHYRDPLPLSNGKIIAAHTAETGGTANLGSRAAPLAKYGFRLKYLTESGGSLIPGESLTTGISKAVSYWDPDVLVTYSGELWELHPAELRPRNRPDHADTSLQIPEATAFTEAGVNPDQFKAWLKAKDLALLVSRNVTSRDAGDIQQAFNLKVEGSNTQTLGATGKIYNISHLQFFQGDLIRGSGSVDAPEPGRRVLAQALHEGIEHNPSNQSGPVGSVKLGADGSMAALVPARRALSWQLTDNAGTAVVRERNWLSFSPGEIRVCASCHGSNTVNQAGATSPQNKPLALVELLQHWSVSNAAVDKACTKVGEQLNLSIQCVEVQGAYYFASLSRYLSPSDPAQLLWKLIDSGQSNLAGQQCATTDTTLNVHIPCALYNNERYKADLRPYVNSIDSRARYWALENVVQIK